MGIPDHQAPPADAPGITPWALPIPPLDPLFTLFTRCRADKHPSTVNLVIGAYRNGAGHPHELRAVTQARHLITNSPSASIHEYEPITGTPLFNTACAQLALGESFYTAHQQSIAVTTSIAGSGALRLAFELAKRALRLPAVLLPTPTWPNHPDIAEATNFKTASYRYYDQTTRTVRADWVVTDLSRAAAGSLVVFHACGHNPSGADLSREDWERVCRVVQERRLIPLFDMAYQGLASGDLDKDAWAVRLFASRGAVLVAMSFSKNLGLYAHRVGALVVVLPHGMSAGPVQGHLARLARAMYSTPPAFGARIVERVLKDERLRAEWKRELAEMVMRMDDMRRRLVDELMARQVPGEWQSMLMGKGMFTILGLSERQIQRMREEHHVYIPEDGRLNVAGLTKENVGSVAHAIAEVVAYAER